MQKIKLLLICVCIASLVHAQQGKAYNFTFNHMALSVKDVDRSAEFYRNVLKLPEITNRSKLEGVRWFSLGEGKELHLIAIIKETVTANKALHLALTTAGFDSFLQELVKSGIAYSDWPGAKGKINVRADGIKQVFFQDPDGYWIEVNSEASK